MKTLDRKYAKDILSIVEQEGFISYRRVENQIKELHEIEDKSKTIDVRTILLALRKDGLIEFTPTSRNSKTKKINTLQTEKMYNKDVCKKFNIVKVTPSAHKAMIEDGWTKTKETVHPYRVVYTK